MASTVALRPADGLLYACASTAAFTPALRPTDGLPSRLAAVNGLNRRRGAETDGLNCRLRSTDAILPRLALSQRPEP
jgi:hypothetical protein